MRSARVLGVLLALCAAVPADAREFRSSDIYPFDYPTVQAVVQVDKIMRERSGGKLGITVLGYDDRDSENYTAAQVRNGQLDMARINLGVLNNIAPMTSVLSLPYLFKSKEHARRVLDGPIGEEILASLEAQGLIGLCFYDGGPRHMYSSKKPIRTPADLYGLRVRVQQADAWASMFRAIGADPVAVPTDRVYLTLQSGVLDASEHNWPSYVSQRHYQVAPYFSMTGHSMSPAVLVFSKRVWDTLKPDEQAIIRSAAKESVPLMRRLWDDYETAGRRTVEAAGGVIVTDVDRKAFADRLVPLYSTAVDNDQVLSLVRRIQADESLEQSERPKD
ncbi:MAG: TRAP transporter substrate-binding protein [Rhodospirillales bacterium]|nr:TRAP transporter substrate-binding protein [Rhodospirillales bacterium]